MPAGRPRYVAPSPKECIEWGEEMVAFLVSPSVVVISDWWCLEKGLLKSEWKNLIQMPEFLPYYEKAQSIMRQKCVNGTIEKSFGQRYLRLYDRDLRDDEDDTKRFESSLRKEEAEVFKQVDVDRLDNFNKKIDELGDHYLKGPAS